MLPPVNLLINHLLRPPGRNPGGHGGVPPGTRGASRDRREPRRSGRDYRPARRETRHCHIARMDDIPARPEERRQTHKLLIDAAVDLLAEGKCLADLGLGPTKVSEKAGIPRRTYADHFGPASRQKLQAAVASRFREWAVEIAKGNRENYQQAITAWGFGSRNRGTIQAALMHDLADWGGRVARLHFLMLALADLDSEVAGTDYKYWLTRAHIESQREYEDIYTQFCELTGREFIDGIERTQRSINAYLEGVNLHQRYGQQPPDEEVLDTMLRIFHATTKPIGREAIDVYEELFGAD
jgi:hypothetical protein